jgi:hypothetical protein
MKSNYERNREGLESVLKRVARSYAMGEIGKEQFDSFAGTIESAFEQLGTMEESNGQAGVDTAVGQTSAD